MPLLPQTQGDRIARLQSRTVYSNYLINKQAVDEGKQTRVIYVGGSGATYDSSIPLVNDVGPTVFVQSELDTILLEKSSITVPEAPRTVTGVAGNAQVVVSWTAPVSNGGSEIIDYTVTSSPGGFTATSYSTSATVTGLTNGTPYTFTLTARNKRGNSYSSSASSSVTPYTLSTAPRTVTGVAGNGQVVVSWTGPVSNGGSEIIDYTVTSSPGGFTATSSSTSATVTGLTNGTPYTFTVTARNIAGNSDPSSASSSVTPRSVPTQPRTVTGVAGNAQVVVSWTEPVSNGGSAIIDYTVTSSPGGFTATSSSTSATVTGLTNGTPYTFTVTARNVAGNSAPSSASSSITPI